MGSTIIRDISTEEALAERDQMQRWYPIRTADLREGDYVSFYVNGRLVEGNISRRPDGLWWCNFKTISREMEGLWSTGEERLFRKGLPSLPQRVYRVLEEIQALPREAFVMLSLSKAPRSGESFDIALAAPVSVPWWPVWEEARMKVQKRAKEVGAGGFIAGSSDAACAAVIGLYLMDYSINKDCIKELLSGWRSVFVAE